MVLVRVVLAALLATTVFAHEVELDRYERPAGLAADPDGTLWFASSFAGNVGRVRPNGELDRVAIPWPYAVERYAPIVVLPDHAALFGSLAGVIAKVEPDLSFSFIDLGSRSISVFDMVFGADGAVWFVATEHPNPPFLGRLTLSTGAVQRFALPGDPTRMRVAPDGTFVISTHNGVARATPTGAVEVIRACTYCASPWLEVTADGTIWFAGGRIDSGGEYVGQEYGGAYATVGPDGAIWMGSHTNALFRLREEGIDREIPFASMREVPGAMVSSGGSLWYAVYGAIRRLDPATNVDLSLQYGDIVAIEREPNCCFEGTHPVLAFHRRGRAPFLRRIERGNAYHGGIYALDPGRIVIEDADQGELTTDDPIAWVLDGAGAVRASIAGPQEGGPQGIVADRAGRLYELRVAGGHQLVTIGAHGVVERVADIPLDPEIWMVKAVDLAADQCTLFYAALLHDGRGTIGRIDVCTATELPAFLDVAEFPRDLRILPGGDLVVVYARRLVRYNATGAVVQQFDAPPEDWFMSVALDRDPRFLWIGSSDLRRVRLDSGEIVERVPVYGYPEKLSVIGEPRAARVSVRRRAARP